MPLDLERIRSLQLSEPARKELAQEVEDALAVEPLTVVRPKRLAPSGDPHDYVSLAAYFWPNPDSEDGLPWIPRDGEVNPERDEGDCMPLFQLCIVVRLLCLGHVLQQDPRCLPQVEERLRIWFLHPRTRMTPHLSYAQYVPGLADGHCWGLIDTTLLPGMLDALLLVETNLDPEVMEGMKGWVSDYATWFLESPLGIEEAAMHNNHASWYVAQAAAYLSFAGRPLDAKPWLEKRAPELILDHVGPDGGQPHELDRTLSYMYSCYNLLAHTASAIYAARIGMLFPIELLETLERAVAYLLPAAQGNEWPWPQIKPLDPTTIIPVLVWQGAFLGRAELREQAVELSDSTEWKTSYRREILGV